MKKVVVLFPYPDEKGTLGQKVFEAKTEEEFIEAINTEEGNLVIKVNAQLPKYTPTILAVFKDWTYWEQIE